MKTFRIDVPKPAAANADGSEVKLYIAGEVVEASEDWQISLMDVFVSNLWATELKMVVSDDAACPMPTPKKAEPKSEKAAAPKKATRTRKKPKPETD
jgi:hypothetical protein